MSSKKILGALALAITGASASQWQLAETYDKTNFFDKFDFFSQNDPTFGHVNYRTREDATELGLVGVEGDDVFMRPDTSGTVDGGRSSVRIESKKVYDHGLFIARFSKVPTPTCGVWPAL
ncbi:hypothetical protein IMZ48_38550 [Candidatus Bathyarchaeota archaeon]|nr:hypothetical protein [Candidatus Bathyarchaeota archaeon]